MGKLLRKLGNGKKSHKREKKIAELDWLDLDDDIEDGEYSDE